MNKHFNPDYEVFIGPCAHGHDPYDRCDECALLPPLEAKVYALEAELQEVRKHLSDADKERVEITSERNEAQAIARQIERTLDIVTKQRDEAEKANFELRAENERLRADLAWVIGDPECDGPDNDNMLQDGPCNICFKCVTRQRDKARAEVEQLSAAFTEGTLKAGDAMRDRLTQVEKERDEARKWLEGICSEFEGAVAHAEWRAAGSKGMSVPFTGDFADMTRHPGVIGRMRWWVKVFRAVLNGEQP